MVARRLKYWISLPRILIVYFSHHGSIARMAEEISFGVETVSDCESVIRSLPAIPATQAEAAEEYAHSGAPYAQLDDLRHCDGLIIGSPGYFGNMAAALKHFLDSTTALWLSGALIGKPAGGIYRHVQLTRRAGNSTHQYDAAAFASWHADYWHTLF